MIAILAALALQQVPLQGIVRDSVSAEPVAFAEVTVADTAEHRVEGSTDAHGAFVIRGVHAASTLTVTAPGYHEWGRRYERLPPTILVLLQPNPIPTAPISATARRPHLAPVDGGAVIDSAVFRALPKVLKTDVLRAATMSPMATSTSDFAAMPAVRGGTGEGVPILLDGVRLFNPFHAPPQWARIEATLSLLAFDSAYVRFADESDEGVLRPPWPDFGIERGVGLFAAAARSARVRVAFVR